MADGQPFQFDEIKVLVTSGCNLNCAHCFRSESKNEYSLTPKQLIEIVDFALSHSTQSLSFSGGEFFVHPFAYELLEYCFSSHLAVKILTNATDINTDFFARYDYSKYVSFQVSVDGTRLIHDQRRGDDSFDLMMTTVQKLAELGIPVTASSVLDYYNYRDILNILELPYFSSFNFLPMASTNAHNGYMDEMSADTLTEYDETIRVLYQREAVFAPASYRCHMFPQGLGINFDGGVFPCAVARDYGVLEMGNLNDRTLEDIVLHFPETSNGKIVLDYQGNHIPECDICNARERCNRGCRVRSLKYHGKLLAPDPFCCRIMINKHDNESINCLFWGRKA